MDWWEALKAVISIIVFGHCDHLPSEFCRWGLQWRSGVLYRSGYRPRNREYKGRLCRGATSGICALGSAFVYEEGSYPKLKKCIRNCSDSNLSNHVYGADLLDGQGCTASPNPTEANGYGSEKANPIVICDYAGLKAMATHGLDKHYALGADINAEGSWAEGAANCTAYDGTIVPSGSGACNGWGLGNLTGALDGGGFQIQKLYRRKEAGNKKLGLFDSLASGAILKNVHLSSVRIHAEGELFNQGDSWERQQGQFSIVRYPEY